MNLGNRILDFFNFCYKQGWECGIVWFENEFHVNVNCNGKVYSSGQAPTLTAALDECANGLQKVGI